MDFEWDDAKAESNYRKHRVRFSEAVSVWQDESALEIPDPDHSKDEERWIRLGCRERPMCWLWFIVKKPRESSFELFRHELRIKTNRNFTI